MSLEFSHSLAKNKRKILVSLISQKYMKLRLKYFFIQYFVKIRRISEKS